MFDATASNWVEEVVVVIQGWGSLPGPGGSARQHGQPDSTIPLPEYARLTIPRKSEQYWARPLVLYQKSSESEF
jgi:hypothetical protein